MEPLILHDEEERRYYFSPLSLKFTRAKEWDGAWADAAWVLPWVRPYTRRLLVAFTLFVFATLTAIVTPRIIAVIVDDVLLSKKYAFAPWFWGLATLIFTKIIADLTYKWIVTKTGQQVTQHLRRDVFHQLGQFPLSFFDKNPSGRLISRCVSDVSNLSAFFTANFFTVVSDIALVIGCAFMMFSLSPWAALTVFLVLIPMGVYMMNVTQAQMRWGREQRNLLSRMTAHTADTMNNLGVLHSQPFTKKWERRHDKLLGIYEKLTTRGIITWGSFSSVHVLVMGLTYSLVVTLGVFQLRAGTLSIGGFIASCTYVGLIFAPFFDISEKLNTLVTALGSAKRLRTFLPHLIVHGPVEHSDAGVEPHGAVVFRDVDFSYRPDRPLFTGLNLTLPEGEVTALVGRTGSGKSTLAQLLMGLYPVGSGEILWGEENLTTLSPARRARWIGHVSQDFFLFSDTLRENLRLWREDVSDEAIRERLIRVGLWEKVQALPGGLDMIIKAETLPLSQGEKQLLLLCRALLQDPRLLIFDEATANLDQLSEEDWIQHVNDLFQGRTTLFIAHRTETLRLASKIVVLENGQVKKTLHKEAGASVREEDLH